MTHRSAAATTTRFAGRRTGIVRRLRRPTLTPADRRRTPFWMQASDPVHPSDQGSPSAAPVSPIKTPITDSASVATEATSEPAPDTRTIPVSASNLHNIMRLASESMIDAARLQKTQRGLSVLRDTQRRFSALLDQWNRNAPPAESSATIAEELRTLNRLVEDRLQDHANQLEKAFWNVERTSTALYHQVIGSRMRPFREGAQAFPRMIRDLARQLGKQVRFQILGESVAVDRDILRKLEAPLNHILRNALDHGIEVPSQREAAGKPPGGQLTLEARHHAGLLTVEVRDDGQGIDPESVRRKVVDRGLANETMAAGMTHEELFEFLFLPGFTTASQVTEVSGRGVGLDVVRSMVQEVSGTVRVASVPGQGTTFTLRLPVTLSVIRAAIAEIGSEPYAFPLAKLVRIVRVPRDEIQPVQGKQQFSLNDHCVGLVRANEVLGLSGSDFTEDTVSVIVLGEESQYCGLAVDRFIGEQDLAVRPLDPRLGKVPHISAAAVTEAGDPLLIVDIEDLLQSIRQMLGEGRLRGVSSLATRGVKNRPKVLVVDDSITVREVQRQLLSLQGYEVNVAVDGQDGWHALHTDSYDLLITDVDMPRMNGIELIRTVRADSRLARLPIIIVSYKDREEDRLLGLEVGANAYLTKGSFHDDSFIRTVSDLIGESE